MSDPAVDHLSKGCVTVYGQTYQCSKGNVWSKVRTDENSDPWFAKCDPTANTCGLHSIMALRHMVDGAQPEYDRDFEDALNDSSRMTMDDRTRPPCLRSKDDSTRICYLQFDGSGPDDLPEYLPADLEVDVDPREWLPRGGRQEMWNGLKMALYETPNRTQYRKSLATTHDEATVKSPFKEDDSDTLMKEDVGTESFESTEVRLTERPMPSHSPSLNTCVLPSMELACSADADCPMPNVGRGLVRVAKQFANVADFYPGDVLQTLKDNLYGELEFPSEKLHKKTMVDRLLEKTHVRAPLTPEANSAILQQQFVANLSFRRSVSEMIDSVPELQSLRSKCDHGHCSSVDATQHPTTRLFDGSEPIRFQSTSTGGLEYEHLGTWRPLDATPCDLTVETRAACSELPSYPGQLLPDKHNVEDVYKIKLNHKQWKVPNVLVGTEDTCPSIVCAHNQQNCPGALCRRDSEECVAR